MYSASWLVTIFLYCLNCTKFYELILSKIIKPVATRCQILRLKFTKFDLGWGSAPDPTGGAYSAPPDVLLNLLLLFVLWCIVTVLF